jgi:hypothetical protein
MLFGHPPEVGNTTGMTSAKRLFKRSVIALGLWCYACGPGAAERWVDYLTACRLKNMSARYRRLVTPGLAQAPPAAPGELAHAALGELVTIKVTCRLPFSAQGAEAAGAKIAVALSAFDWVL